MYFEHQFYLGLSDEGRVVLPLHMANRHGLIAGASGTGKTITMKVMADPKIRFRRRKAPLSCAQRRVRRKGTAAGAL